LQLLDLPRDFGVYEELGEPILAHNGRFGPYIKCGAETRSIPAEIGLLVISREQAIELLKQPRTRGKGAPKEPLKVFEKSPVTEQEIKLLEGRYGPYLTDGDTNASVPKGTSIEEVTFELAVRLLAERFAAGGSKKKTKKKAAKKATKKAAPKKAKTAVKQAAVKKTAKKATKKAIKKATTKTVKKSATTPAAADETSEANAE